MPVLEYLTFLGLLFDAPALYLCVGREKSVCLCVIAVRNGVVRFGHVLKIKKNRGIIACKIVLSRVAKLTEHGQSVIKEIKAEALYRPSASAFKKGCLALSLESFLIALEEFKELGISRKLCVKRDKLLFSRA